MKNQIFSLCALALALFTLSSCGKDREQIKAAISETQLSYMIESAMQAGMGGFTGQLEMAVEIAQETVSSQCGVTKDTTIITENETTIGSSEYTTQYTWTLECENDVTPLNYDFICHSQGSYNNNHMTSNDYGDADWVLEGLSQNVNEFSANGTFDRNGEQTFKADGIVTESNIDFVVTNLNIDKSNEEINSGSAKVNVHGSTDSGESFDFEGQIVFLGNGKAKLTVNGKTFIINL
ncbi:MAG: hypothetical protein K9J37_18015 [Saprospiraceae bacterium]|nr:hypothetical protein [Saprospiraceae bacterium]MCF8251815.1 hypothetical protein [Saprospiraceae bacterium]MCF8281469.1 hypothetical protein [Bacteroidales bacterium]MCF8313529.1 hypothetical protein [Saprospiraceae bacterium]MCF8442248.1 hypothetical protein [Saprospiraceae bacterium]